MKTDRRTFLKFLGLASVAPKIGIDILSKAKETGLTFYSEPFVIDQGRNLRAQAWAEALLNEHKKSSYFGSKNPLFNDSIAQWDGVTTIYTHERK